MGKRVGVHGYSRAAVTGMFPCAPQARGGGRRGGGLLPIVIGPKGTAGAELFSSVPSYQGSLVAVMGPR